MDITGTLVGAYARRWPMFMYRLPKPVPPLTLRSADPNRLDPLKEYPRDTAFYTPELATDDLLDYAIRDTGSDERGLCIVKVYLRHNRYSQVAQTSNGAKETLIAEYHCSRFGDMHMMYDEIIKEAIGGEKSALLRNGAP